MLLAGMGLISCTPCITEKPEHEVESIDELIDSMIIRNGLFVNRRIQCYKDTLSDYHNIITVAQDTMGLDTLDVDAWYKRLVANIPPKSVRDTMKYYIAPHNLRRTVENHQYMIRNATHLLEKLCKTAIESYRYIDKDSINYSITLSNNPKQLLKAQRWTFGNSNNEFHFSYIKENKVKVTAKPYDRRPVQQLIKKFLAEHKDVKQYPVSYDWDEGVPFPSDYDESRLKFCFQSSTRKTCKKALAASHVTGIHYAIPVENEKSQELMKDFTNRMIRMAVEQPVPGSRLELNIHTEGDKKLYLMEKYCIGNNKTRWPFTYQIMIDASWGDGFHILELDCQEATRYTIPCNWSQVLRTHNTDIEYIGHTKEKNKEESDTKECIDYNFFNH